MIQESFFVYPRPPFRLDLTVWTLRRRAHNQIDQWDGTTYTRVLLFDQVPVKVGVSQLHPTSPPQLLINVWSPESGERLSIRVKEMLQRMLGFPIDLTGFYTLARNDQTIHPLVQNFLGMKPPRFPSLFEAFFNAFACQQVTLDVGLMLQKRRA
jgi:DNA-3-methyladenine glycosylase II